MLFRSRGVITELPVAPLFPDPTALQKATHITPLFRGSPDIVDIVVLSLCSWQNFWEVDLSLVHGHWDLLTGKTS